MSSEVNWVGNSDKQNRKHIVYGLPLKTDSQNSSLNLNRWVLGGNFLNAVLLTAGGVMEKAVTLTQT